MELVISYGVVKYAGILKYSWCNQMEESQGRQAYDLIEFKKKPW